MKYDRFAGIWKSPPPPFPTQDQDQEVISHDRGWEKGVAMVFETKMHFEIEYDIWEVCRIFEIATAPFSHPRSRPRSHWSWPWVGKGGGDCFWNQNEFRNRKSNLRSLHWYRTCIYVMHSRGLVFHWVTVHGVSPQVYSPLSPGYSRKAMPLVTDRANRYAA